MRTCPLCIWDGLAAFETIDRVFWLDGFQSVAASLTHPTLDNCRIEGATTLFTEYIALALHNDLLCGQFLVRYPLAANRTHKAVQPLKSVILYVALVEPPAELICVSASVLGRDVVVNAIYATLEHSPDALDAVCAGAASRVLASRMIHGLMTVKESVQIAKNNAVIRVELCSDFDAVMDLLCDGLQSALTYRSKDGAPITFAHPKHGSLSDSAATSAELLVLMLVGFLAADKTLINFHYALELLLYLWSAHGFAETLQNEPRGFLRDSNFFRELQAADALAGSNEQIHRVEPLVERHFAALKYRTCADREIGFSDAIAAVISRLATQSDNALPALAFGACWAIRPQARLKIESRGLLVGKHREKLESADSRTAHELTPKANFRTIRMHVDPLDGNLLTEYGLSAYATTQLDYCTLRDSHDLP